MMTTRNPTLRADEHDDADSPTGVDPLEPNVSGPDEVATDRSPTKSTKNPTSTIIVRLGHPVG